MGGRIHYLLCKIERGRMYSKLHYILKLESNINNGEQIPWDCFSLASVQFYCSTTPVLAAELHSYKIGVMQ